MAKSIEELVNEPWRKKIKWDISHEDAVLMTEQGTFYFDPLLSYETTGYRPINEKHGLDFDPTGFREVGASHMLLGKYTELHFGSKKHQDWWRQQHERSDDGFVVNGYRITGDNYFFLNFYHMLVAQKGAKAGAGRKMVHPDFWVAHYEWFHYIELAEILGYDALALKARGVGFSEIGACLGVRPFITTPSYNAMYVASYEPYLKGKGILQKCWTQLDWLNQNTEGGMRRVRQGTNTDLHKKASKLNKQGEEFGHLSQISGQVVDKPDKLRGDRTERIIFEESGSNPALLGTYGVAEPLVIINGDRVGTRIVFGTGGDDEESQTSKNKSGLFGLEKMFLNPRGFKILPYRHRYSSTNQWCETGFFLPAWRTIRKCMDHRGFVKEVDGKAHYQKDRDALISEPEALLKHCAEYCWTFEEALSRKGSNRFDQAKLAEQHIAIDVHKSTPKPKRGYLSWIRGAANEVTGVKFTEHLEGTVEIIEEPIPDIPHLYVAGIDSIDVGADESIVGDAGSKFCIVVKKRMYGMDVPTYVAKYLERPGDVRKAYEVAMMLLYWYNCKANVEATRLNIISYFREKGFIRHLMNRPKYAIEGQSNARNGANLIGTQASPAMINYGLDLVKDYIFDYCHMIFFSDMVKQLQEYSDDLKGKFDIVAAMQMCEIGDQDMMGITPRREEPEVWDDVGYYMDEYGKRRYGIIPKNNINNDFLFRNTY